MPPLLRPAVAAVAAAVVAGCGGAGEILVPVSGRLVDGGKDFAFDMSKAKLPPGATGFPPGATPVQVTFTPVEGGDPAPAVLDTTGWTFKVAGRDGKGIKPGKYKVAVTGGAGGGAADYFGGKFSPEKTQIIRDVTPGQDIVIDVSKPQG